MSKITMKTKPTPSKSTDPQSKYVSTSKVKKQGTIKPVTIRTYPSNTATTSRTQETASKSKSRDEPGVIYESSSDDYEIYTGVTIKTYDRNTRQKSIVNYDESSDYKMIVFDEESDYEKSEPVPTKKSPKKPVPNKQSSSPSPDEAPKLKKSGRKSTFSTEQDAIILSHANGATWDQILEQVKGKSDVQIKRRYTLLDNHRTKKFKEEVTKTLHLMKIRLKGWIDGEEYNSMKQVLAQRGFDEDVIDLFNVIERSLVLKEKGVEVWARRGARLFRDVLNAK
jgi:hypothetical protein